MEAFLGEHMQDRTTQAADPALNILVVDDDIPTRILLRAALNQWGYKIQEAGDGEEAWKILQSDNSPQILISDWMMPKLDGLGLCERIQKELKTPPYIILLTQMSGTANIIKGLEAGADEFLAKPFNMAELRSRLSVGARIIQYEKRLKENLVSLNSESMMESLHKQVEQLGGTIEENVNDKTRRIVIELPINIK